MDTHLPPPAGAPPAPIAHPLIHADGVYFGLPEDDYHKAFALSASGIKHLRVSTLDFWVRSPLNSEREAEGESESFAKTLGRAYHKRILEGAAAFRAAYAPDLDIADHPGALKSNDELAERCKALGVKSSGKKSDLIARILEADPEHADVIWERLLAAHAQRHAGKLFLPAALIKKIEIAAAMIEKHPVLGRAITGGMPEVSVFWRDAETGVPLKCRFDYLKPRALIDLKTAENSIGLPIDKAVAKAIASYRLHIQAALYLEAVGEAKRLIAAGRIVGAADPGVLAALAAAPPPVFLFLFQMKGVAPVARGYILPPGMTLDIGRQEVEIAKAAFQRSWRAYGGDPWVDTADIVTLDPTCFPAWIAD